MPQEDDFVTVAGAARLAGVSQVTIRRWMDDPDIKVTKYKDDRGRVYADRNEITARTKPVPVPEASA